MGEIDRKYSFKYKHKYTSKVKKKTIIGGKEADMERSWTSRLQILSLMAEQTIPRMAGFD